MSHNLSKKMSYTLRHHPDGLSMSTDGFVSIASLLAHPRFKGYTVNDILHVVQTSDKQRFALNEQSTCIRANQGHSVKNVPDLELEPMTRFDGNVIHGTYKEVWPLIEKDGLSKM